MEDREIEVPRQVYETITRTVQRPKTVMEEKTITIQEPKMIQVPREVFFWNMLLGNPNDASRSSTLVGGQCSPPCCADARDFA